MKSRFWLFAALGVLLGTSAGVAWATTNWMGSEAPVPTTLRTEYEKQQLKAAPESAIGGGPHSMLDASPPRPFPLVPVIRHRVSSERSHPMTQTDVTAKPTRARTTIRATPVVQRTRTAAARTRTAAVDRSQAIRDNSHIAAQSARNVTHSTH